VLVYRRVISTTEIYLIYWYFRGPLYLKINVHLKISTESDSSTCHVLVVSLSEKWGRQINSKLFIGHNILTFWINKTPSHIALLSTFQ
jgi:hypothetical protein